MMATALALCPPTPPIPGEVITIYAPTARAAAEARANLPLDLVVVAAPSWAVSRTALGASSCLIVRTPPVALDGEPGALAVLAEVRRAYPRLAVMFESADEQARVAAVGRRRAPEVVGGGDASATLWSRVQGALTAAMLEAAADRTLTAPGLAPHVRAWLAGLWSLPVAPRAVGTWYAAYHVSPGELALGWPSRVPSPETLVTWTLLLHTAVHAARGESWRTAAESTGLDARSLRHALSRSARLRAGELGAPVVPTADNPHARLRRAFRRRVLEPLLGA